MVVGMPPVKEEMRRCLSCGQLLQWRPNEPPEGRAILRLVRDSDSPMRRATCVCGVEYWVRDDEGSDAAAPDGFSERWNTTP